MFCAAPFTQGYPSGGYSPGLWLLDPHILMEIDRGIALKRKRKKRRKNRSNPESVPLEGAKAQLTVENEAPVLDGGAANGEAANREVGELEPADENAVAPEASDGKATERDAAAGEAEGLEAATLKVVEPEPADPEAAVAEGAASEAPDEVAGELEAAVEGAVGPEAAERKPGDRKAADRRQHARFVVGGRTKGRVTAIYDARILDISPGGSLIEHADVVRPGTLSSLDLDLLGKRMSLKCRVARSVVHRSEVQPDGDRQLIYRTGLEFLDRSDETRKMIIDYIQSVIEDGNKS